MGATTVAAALSDFQAISQTVGTLKGGTVGADNLDDELSSDLESQEAVVDKPVTAIVIGAGARGRTYASYSEHYPNSLKIVGVADINTERKEYMKNLYRIPDEHCFSDWKEVFNVPKFADAVIIATPDNLHYEPALKAMAAGYDLLLEKPVAQSIKECTDILCRHNSHSGRRSRHSHCCRNRHRYRRSIRCCWNNRRRRHCRGFDRRRERDETPEFRPYPRSHCSGADWDCFDLP